MSVRTTTLANGLRVVSEVMPALRTAAVGVWVDAGARNEAPEINGVAHLLEHMAFKGTTSRSARMIAEEIEAVGGYLNAFTGREQTAYYARVMAADVPLAINLLADIIQRSVFDDADIERECGVVVQEIGEAADVPDDAIFDQLQATAFPAQAIGRPILGTVERVRGLRRPHLVSFLGANYRASEMVVAAAGAVEHDRIVDLASKAFADLLTPAAKVFEPARYGGGEYREARDLEQMHLALAFPTVAFDHPDYYAVQVYAMLLGGGTSSRLYQEIRENRGLAYSVSAAAVSFSDTGLMTIYAGTAPESLTELLPIIGDEMRKTAATVSAEEVARARAQLTAGLVMSLESPSSRIEQMARQSLVLGRTLETDEVLANVEAVDCDHVLKIVHSMLQNRPTIAVLGTVKGFEKVPSLAARCGLNDQPLPAAVC
jgi:predicted Zn-dependent peptidase